ncbi:MAG: hypothetical protein AAF327_15840 [Cyanobacteria bacterium P01_A01_bin.37]
MTTYLLIADALTRTKERSGATDGDDTLLTELLNQAAGTVGGVTHYRPFYVAARFIEQNTGVQTLSEAKGVKFTGQWRVIASLMSTQAAYDSANGLTVPTGYEAQVTSALPRYSSRSSVTVSRP